MNFVGIDLHKKTISLCVVDQERNVLNRKQFYCSRPGRIVAFFEELGPFRAVVEATASYEWHGQARPAKRNRGQDASGIAEVAQSARNQACPCA